MTSTLRPQVPDAPDDAMSPIPRPHSSASAVVIVAWDIAVPCPSGFGEVAVCGVVVEAQCVRDDSGGGLEDELPERGNAAGGAGKACADDELAEGRCDFRSVCESPGRGADSRHLPPARDRCGYL
jgi:hypothetical protein